jgi:exosortase A-associated hydrolase 2
MSAATATARTSTARAAFVTVNGRRLYTLQIVPTGAVRGSILYLPPFVEEMNRCRASVAAMARLLAARGWQVMLPDHVGTGESEGEIADGRWEHWRDDAAALAAQLQADSGHVPMLWGIRLGALLAAELVHTGAVSARRLLFWQPVLDGKLYLNQHLRLRIASQLVADGERETTDSIRKRLAAGEDVEVAGYVMTDALAAAFERRRMADWQAALAGTRLHWLEMVAQPQQPLGVPSRKLVDALTAAGAQVQTETVACPLIWQMYEKFDAGALLQATLAQVGDAA